MAIIGENGSETTLLKHVNGLLVPQKVESLSTGWIPTNENLPRLRTIVGMVYQNPADQIVASTVAEDIAFGLEISIYPLQRYKNRWKNNFGRLECLKQQSDLPTFFPGQIQVALAGACAAARVILFDEPTSMLIHWHGKPFCRLCANYDRMG